MIENSQESITVGHLAAPNFDRTAVSSDLLQDVFVKCTRCQELLYVREWKRNLKVCGVCGYHFRLSTPERIANLSDEGSFVEADKEMKSGGSARFYQSLTYLPKFGPN